jgi:hypothetical protein
VLSNLGLYYGLAGDPARGIASCRAAIELARQHDARVSIHTAHSFLTQLAVMDLDADPIPVLCEALERAHADRVGLHTGMIVTALATWWTAHGQREDAAIAVGHLDAHRLRGYGSYSLDHSVDATRATTLESRPELEPWLSRGAALDRDEFVRYVLERCRTTRVIDAGNL